MRSVRMDVVMVTASDAELDRFPTSWSTALGGIATELKLVAGTTEDEFLAIGGRLQDFYLRGVGISSLASEMLGEVAGEHVSDAIDRFEEMLDEMGCYVNSAQKEIERSSATLREILGLLGRVAGPLSGFKKINKVLRILGISTKIESARLGPRAAGFDTLASDVGDLAVQVNEKAGFILARKDELAKAIEQTLAGVLESGAQQHDQVLGILGKLRGSLAALTAINGRCTSAAAGISAVSEGVSRNIGEVVISMQANDIVRQQIEHVEQTLFELKGSLVADSAGADEVACLCELQTAQLRHAAGELDAAVQTIIGNLREVARKQSGLTKETSSMAGIADQAGGSFFTEMQRDISAVTVTLLESSKVNHSLCVAMGSVADTIGEIAHFVGDIEMVGEEIKLIALNAQIRSAYTGDEGAALGVLAEAIQRLSIDAIDHTAAVSGTLYTIIEVTERLRAGVCVEASSLETEVLGMVANLSTLLDVLQAVNETLHRSLFRMDDAVRLLSSDIDQVTAGISVHRKVSQVLDEAALGLCGIMAEARRMAPASVQGASFGELASRYTMQSERKIHASLLEGETVRQAPPSVDDGLGENVEFF